MTAQRYVHDILQPHVLPLMQRLQGAIFQQDYARSHTARVLLPFLILPDSQICLQSSIYEIIWDGVEHPTSLNELEARLQQMERNV
ncbi:transposable element Tcb2 transposase [Trichonephila clavipes]|uniref:Transposable element Tcb2 transposase n=1 Tax=Trichonephila clavipes TaxID=2585209 RepID=A0A8X6RTD9_TRICX|nr:transposable element Tcb2 transposase [Trichonephila clavipes]